MKSLASGNSFTRFVALRRGVVAFLTESPVKPSVGSREPNQLRNQWAYGSCRRFEPGRHRAGEGSIFRTLRPISVTFTVSNASNSDLFLAGFEIDLAKMSWIVPPPAQSLVAPLARCPAQEPERAPNPLHLTMVGSYFDRRSGAAPRDQALSRPSRNQTG